MIARAPQIAKSPMSLRGPIPLVVFGVFVLTSALTVLGIFVVVLTGRAAGTHDFISYWAAGKQLIHGANPYNTQIVLELEKSAGFGISDRALIMRNPPSALFLTVPLGMVSARVGSILWSFLILGCLVGSVHMLRQEHRGRGNHLYLIGYFFAPSLACLATGQTAVFVLFGLVLFLHFQRSEPLLAGAALALCALKPHLFLPFAAAMIAWIVTRRAYRVLLGMALAFSVCCVIPLFFDASIWRQYAAMAHGSGIEREFMPVFGVVLRFAIDRDAMWLQFLPALVACVWATWYFWRHRTDWDWGTHGPLLMLVSLLAAPYSWFTDQAVLLPAVLQGIYAGRENSLVVILALISAAQIQLLCAVSMHSVLFMWPVVAWLVWYLWSTWHSRDSHLPELAHAAKV